MKKRMITLAMALCISATMVVPASAATADVQEAHKAEMNVSIQQSPLKVERPKRSVLHLLKMPSLSMVLQITFTQPLTIWKPR